MKEMLVPTHKTNNADCSAEYGKVDDDEHAACGVAWRAMVLVWIACADDVASCRYAATPRLAWAAFRAARSPARPAVV